MDAIQKNHGPFSPPLVSVVALLCEKILNEQDHVLSAIRIVDLFHVLIRDDVPIEKQAVPMHLLVMARFEPEDHSAHVLRLRLQRPNGDLSTILDGEPTLAVPDAKHPNHPPGINLAAAIGIIPKQMGTHFVRVDIDSTEVAAVHFTLARKGDTAENQL